MPDIRDAGRAMADVNTGQSALRAENAAMDLSALTPNAPAEAMANGEFSPNQGMTPGAINPVQLGLPANVPPEALEAALAAMAAGQEPGLVPETPLVPKEPAQGQSTNTPTAPAAAIIPSNAVPVTGAVDLDALDAARAAGAQAPGATALEGAAGTPATAPQGAAANAAQPSVPQQSAGNQQTQQQQTQVQQQQVVSNQRVTASDDLIIETPEGPKTWKEINGERMLKRNFSKEKQDLLNEKRVVDQQKKFLDIAAGDRFASNYLQAIAHGDDKETAFKNALTVAGMANTAIPQTQTQTPVTAPEWPKDDDPDYGRKVGEFVAFRSAKAVEEKLQPLEARFAQLGESDRKAEQARGQLAENQKANNELFASFVTPLVPQLGTQAEAEIVANHLAKVGEEIGVLIDAESYSSKRLSDVEVRWLADKAFPNGQLPPHVQQAIAALGNPSNGTNQSVQSPATNGAPLNGAASLNGTHLNGQAAHQPQLQGQLQTQANQQQVPLQQRWASLSAMQQQAILQQVGLNQAAINQGAAQMGSNPFGQPPGIPREPALNAGPNPGAINFASTQMGSPLRPEASIAQQMGALKPV